MILATFVIAACRREDVQKISHEVCLWTHESFLSFPLSTPTKRNPKPVHTTNKPIGTIPPMNAHLTQSLHSERENVRLRTFCSASSILSDYQGHTKTYIHILFQQIPTNRYIVEEHP